MTDPTVGEGGFQSVDGEIANLVVTGKEFDVGPRRFKVKRVLRGSVSDIDALVIPIFRDKGGGIWHLGLYRDPDVEPQSSLIVAFELQRVA